MVRPATMVGRARSHGWLRRKLPLALAGFFGLLGLFNSDELPAQETSSLSGVVVDGSTGDPMEGVDVSLRGVRRTTRSDGEGRFLFRDLQPGTYVLEIRDRSYGEFEQPLEVPAQEAASIRIALTADGMSVRREPSGRRSRSSGGLNVVEREEIRRGAEVGLSLGEFLSREVPGIRIRSSSQISGTGLCVEFRGARTFNPQRVCQSPMILLDGVQMGDPTHVWTGLALDALRRIRVVPPSEAGVRYGSYALYGVVLLESLGSEGFGGGASGPELLPAWYDWSREPDTHSGRTVFLAAFLGNALAVAAGTGLADICLDYDKIAYNNLASECGFLGTAGAVAAAGAAPLVTTTLVARWAGETEFSRGRIAEALVTTAFMLLPGYALSISGRGTGSSGSTWAGRAFVFLGVPLAVTISDRIFRDVLAGSPSREDPRH